ncbi:MAG: glycosyl hydrolase [Gemmatimonadetes bacterium]|nr:glycosyl hydrolase [Gemmatimonadota bacterium]
MTNPHSIRRGGLLVVAISAGFIGSSGAQVPDTNAIKKAAAGLMVRSLGPALMSGRIADLEVNPRDKSTWYVAAGSGGVWKTTNAGTTFTPVFDDQPSYSIGEITLDPSNPEIVWVGTGENVSGRHVGWGDGVYRSRDGGRTWQRMGLAKSEHIGRILVHPKDGNVVLVAAEGPLWSAGGERGVYRSKDGGVTWTPVLQIDEHTGVTDLEFDPSNPEVVYAAAYQRRRHVWGFLGGGPQSAIYKSADGGVTWRRLATGLPKGDMGKIGLAVTAADPSLVYATIEAGEGERGFYRSRDKGESWDKRNGYISGGTGPHYYQEIEASPTDPNRVYQMDVFFHVTRNGGATFDYLETGHEKHSDNHALWIDPADGRHLLAGTDSGVYESFDEGATWRHFRNLPLGQFYKVALSNTVPFYQVLGGAQDAGTQHGPSRTMNRDGIRNQDWYVPFGADGYGVAIDPRDDNILYLMSQEGNLYRKDRRTEEGLNIRPQPAPGDPPERWNWDSPLLLSPHNPDRVYFGSQRVWRSEDRGSSWTAISGDLTQGANRYERRFMGRVWSVDALHDNSAMSKYATLTAITESPVQAGVLMVGTDDGTVQVSANGGQNWIPAAPLPGLPLLSFINDVEASLFDARTAYVAADAHKIGDFSPYLFETTDAGRTWRPITGDLPKGTLVWSIQQDHVKPDLLFAGTESGIYFTINRGANWVKLSGGVPTISFRDLKIHRRDNDLVGATFGRGFYILDDYAPLREFGPAAFAAEARLFSVRDAWWFVPSQLGQAAGRPEAGSDDYTAANPPMGAIFTYYLREALTTARERREAAERALRDGAKDTPFPGFDQLRAEAAETAPRVLIRIADAAGRPVRWIVGSGAAGLHRVNWDLRGPAPDPGEFSQPGFRAPWESSPLGPLAAPGRYTAELMIVSAAGARRIGEPQGFEVKPVPNALPGTDYVAVAAFQHQVAELMRKLNGAGAEIDRARERLRYMRAALVEAPRADPGLSARMDSVTRTFSALSLRLRGDPIRRRLDESAVPSIQDRVGEVIGGHWETRQTPTATQRREIEVATAEFGVVARALAEVVEGDLVKIEAALEAAGAPWTPGRRVPVP